MPSPDASPLNPQQTKGTTPYHVIGLKCPNSECGGYNTRQIMDVDSNYTYGCNSSGSSYAHTNSSSSNYTHTSSPEASDAYTNHTDSTNHADSSDANNIASS